MKSIGKAERENNNLFTHMLTTLNKSKRSQSALEYMMTYGWAILLIVIVAVILYSMGIFNPSSSITSTSTGFTPLTISSSICSNLGLKIAVILGPIPNNANSISIDKIYLISETGTNTTNASYTLPSSITLTSGQSATILIPNVACDIAGIKYALSAAIQYNYEVSPIGNQVVNTSGIIAGTSTLEAQPPKPSVFVSYLPVIITNSQTTATPSPFQQMVNVSYSIYKGNAYSNFQNVEFYYSNGTIIPSWLENYTYSKYAIYWIKIGSIPASSSITIYMGFASNSTNLFNAVDAGEAPQLSSTYGEYDDGANVFIYYTNFEGTSLPTGWDSTSSTSYNVNNGISVSTTSGACYNSGLYTTSTYGEDTVVDFYGSFTGSLPDTYCDQSGIGYFEANSGTHEPAVLFSTGTKFYGLYTITGSGSVNLTFLSGSYKVYSITYDGLNSTGLINYNKIGEVNQSGFPLPIGIYEQESTGITDSVKWINVRAYPPNGVMPSVTFGLLS